MERKSVRKYLALLLPLILAQSLLAEAQVALPNVRLPNLPGGLPSTGLPLNGDRTLSGLSNDLDPRRLEDLRRLHILDLIRKNPKDIEADPNGAPILRGEVVAFSPSEAALGKARAAGFAVVRERVLEGLDARLVVLKVPDGIATRRALKQLKGLDPQGAYDFNHLYTDSGEVLGGGAAGERGAGGDLRVALGGSPLGGGTQRGLDVAAAGSGVTPFVVTGADASVDADRGVGEVLSGDAGRDVGTRLGSATEAGAGVSTVAGASGGTSGDVGSGTINSAGTRVGLIDGGVDVSHDVFHDIVIHQHGCSGAAVPAAHGTAVASLMIGRSPRFHGAAPGSELYAADVYCGLPTGGAVDAVADALAWLVRERVPVINVSLVGPPNVMLENVVRMVIARGHVVVAAVGNDGPAAPPLYPASYPDVVGVTAVDAHQRALLEACRGRQVKFSAPGADMSAANPAQSYAVVRGTSFASPIVAGLLAEAVREPDKAAAQRAVADLATHAIDLGAPGPDPVYGFGLVGGDLHPELALVGNRSK
jgi:Subtilase family